MPLLHHISHARSKVGLRNRGLKPLHTSLTRYDRRLARVNTHAPGIVSRSEAGRTVGILVPGELTLQIVIFALRLAQFFRGLFQIRLQSSDSCLGPLTYGFLGLTIVGPFPFQLLASKIADSPRAGFALFWSRWFLR